MPDPAATVRMRLGRRADFASVGLTVGFAFLAASFPARNSDLWRHLAAGRLVAMGEYQFGVDPFAYTTAGVYWANHAWLTDWAAYRLFDRAGGGALVVLKAVGAAALAGLMLRAGHRAGGPVWVSAGCTVLAALAMSPRLLLQPACLSLVLLGLSLQLLRAGGRAVYLLLVVMAVWVNLDGWFLLGPVLVGLVSLGQRAAPDPAVPRLPGWLAPACVGACLVSPHHVRAFVPPPELSPAVWGSAFADDPRFAGFFASPWHAAPLGRAGGYSPAAWAYFILVGLGLLSFAASRRASVGWRGLVWLAFAALGAWQARLVPFFAVVAGPITALNLGDRMRAGVGERAGRLLVIGGTLALGVLAWPGWLQGLYHRDRAAGWVVEPDPSHVRLAERLRRWRDGDPTAAGGRVFAADPDAAHHLVWFAPGERVFLDSRLTLFSPVAGNARAVARSLTGDPEPVAERVVGRYRIVRAVADAPGDGWTPADFAGRLWVLRRTGVPGVTGGFDPDRAAFGPSADDGLPVAPVAGPDLPPPPAWWDLAAGRSRPRAWETDAAGLFVRLALLRREADPSPAPALLAVRAARVGIARHPDAADAWLAAARAYRALGPGEFPPLADLRRVQTAAALVQAVTIDPNAVAAHDGLAGVYADQGFLDLALDHRRELRRLARRSGATPDESVVEPAESTVLDNENRFRIRTVGLAGDPLARARIALDLGLAGKALDTLLQSHPDLYGADGLRLVLDLLVRTGRVAEARVLLDRDELRANPDALGRVDMVVRGPDGRPSGYPLHAVDWYDFLQAAGAGRYDRADLALRRLRDRLEREEAAVGPPLAAALALQLAAEAGLGVPPASALGRLRTARERERLAGWTAQVRMLTVGRADLHTLAGLLGLERGEVATAADEFDRADILYTRSVQLAVPGKAVAARLRAAVRANGR